MQASLALCSEVALLFFDDFNIACERSGWDGQSHPLGLLLDSSATLAITSQRFRWSCWSFAIFFRAQRFVKLNVVIFAAKVKRHSLSRMLVVI